MSIGHKKIRFLSISLRAANLGSRFLFIFFLARYLNSAQLGLYGLLAATIGYSLYLLGFDFYTFTTREILKIERSDWGGLIKNQGALSLILYFIFLPILSLIFFRGFLPWSVFGWFFALLIIEHLNQELSRLLIAISEQLWASIILFVRQGSWAIAVTLLMIADSATRSLDFVFGAWVVSGLLAFSLGVYRLAKFEISGWFENVDWKWIAKGLKITIPFLFSTLAIRGVFTLDRYWLQSIGGIDIVGAYVIFMGVAGTLMAFLDAGVFSFSYPNLIIAHQKKDAAKFSENMRQLFLYTLVISIGFAFVSLMLISPLLSWIANPIYILHINLYPWVLACMIIYALGMIPHYGLYAQGFDKIIIKSHIAGLVMFIFSTASFSLFWPLLAVPMGLCCAFFIIFLWKTWVFIKLTPLQYRSVRI